MPCRVVAEVSSTDWKASRANSGSLRSLLMSGSHMGALDPLRPPATDQTGSTGSTEALAWRSPPAPEAPLADPSSDL